MVNGIHRKKQLSTEVGTIWRAFRVYVANERPIACIATIFTKVAETATGGAMTPRLEMEFPKINIFMETKVLPTLCNPA